MAIQTRGQPYANTDAGFDPRVSLDGLTPQQVAQEVVPRDPDDMDLFERCQEVEALWAYHTWIGCFAPREAHELWHIPRAIKHLIPYYEHEFFRLVGELFHEHFPDEAPPVFASELLKPIYRINFPQNLGDAGRPNGDLGRVSAWGFAALAQEDAQAAFIEQVAPHQELLKIACRALRRCIRDGKHKILPAQLKVFRNAWNAYVNASPVLRQAAVTLSREDIQAVGVSYYTSLVRQADDEIHFTEGVLPDEVTQRRAVFARNEAQFQELLRDQKYQKPFDEADKPVVQHRTPAAGALRPRNQFKYQLFSQQMGMEVGVEEEYELPAPPSTLCQQIGDFFRGLFHCLCCCFSRGSRESL